MILRYLDCSTAHLKKDTINNLSDSTLPFTYTYDEGIFISVPDQFDILEETHISQDLFEILRYAWQNDIGLIRLDNDAEVITDLKTYSC